MATATQTSPTDLRHLFRPALSAFFAISEKWGLNSEQERRLLGLPGRSAFSRWKREHRGRFSHDVIERISYVLGIYKALHILFADNKQADSWVTRANAAPLFCGQTALDRMLAGQVADLYLVRCYLDTQGGSG